MSKFSEYSPEDQARLIKAKAKNPNADFKRWVDDPESIGATPAPSKPMDIIGANKSMAGNAPAAPAESLSAQFMKNQAARSSAAESQARDQEWYKPENYFSRDRFDLEVPKEKQGFYAPGSRGAGVVSESEAADNEGLGAFAQRGAMTAMPPANVDMPSNMAPMAYAEEKLAKLAKTDPAKAEELRAALLKLKESGITSENAQAAGTVAGLGAGGAVAGLTATAAPFLGAAAGLSAQEGARRGAEAVVGGNGVGDVAMETGRGIATPVETLYDVGEAAFTGKINPRSLVNAGSLLLPSALGVAAKGLRGVRSGVSPTSAIGETFGTGATGRVAQGLDEAGGAMESSLRSAAIAPVGALGKAASSLSESGSSPETKMIVDHIRQDPQLYDLFRKSNPEEAQLIIKKLEDEVLSGTVTNAAELEERISTVMREAQGSTFFTRPQNASGIRADMNTASGNYTSTAGQPLGPLAGQPDAFEQVFSRNITPEEVVAVKGSRLESIDVPVQTEAIAGPNLPTKRPPGLTPDFPRRESVVSETIPTPAPRNLLDVARLAKNKVKGALTGEPYNPGPKTVSKTVKEIPDEVWNESRSVKKEFDPTVELAPTQLVESITREVPTVTNLTKESIVSMSDDELVKVLDEINKLKFRGVADPKAAGVFNKLEGPDHALLNDWREIALNNIKIRTQNYIKSGNQEAADVLQKVMDARSNYASGIEAFKLRNDVTYGKNMSDNMAATQAEKRAAASTMGDSGTTIGDEKPLRAALKSNFGTPGNLNATALEYMKRIDDPALNKYVGGLRSYHAAVKAGKLPTPKQSMAQNANEVLSKSQAIAIQLQRAGMPDGTITKWLKALEGGASPAEQAAILGLRMGGAALDDDSSGK